MESRAGSACRICMASDAPWDMFSPCRCKGSLRFVHQTCLRSWLATGDFASKTKCPICHERYSLRVKGQHRSEFFSVFLWLLSVLAMVLLNTLFTLMFIYYMRCMRSHGRTPWNPEVLFFLPSWLIHEVDAQDIVRQSSGECVRAGAWSLRGAFVYGTAKFAHQTAAVILCHRSYNYWADQLDRLRNLYSGTYPWVADLSPALIHNVALISVVGSAFKLWRAFSLAEMPQHVNNLPVWLLLILVGSWFEFHMILRISRSAVFWYVPPLKKWLLGDLEILPHDSQKGTKFD